MSADPTTLPAARLRARRGVRFGVLLVVLLLPFANLAAEADEPAIWSLDSNGGEVLLLGSVHLLRPEDYPLPTNVTQAYDAADRLVVVAERPHADALRCFRATGLQGVQYAANVWHHPLLVLAREQDFLVVDREGPGDNLEEIGIAPQAEIRVR